MKIQKRNLLKEYNDDDSCDACGEDFRPNSTIYRGRDSGQKICQHCYNMVKHQSSSPRMREPEFERPDTSTRPVKVFPKDIEGRLHHRYSYGKLNSSDHIDDTEDIQSQQFYDDPEPEELNEVLRISNILLKEELTETVMCYNCENDFWTTGSDESLSCPSCKEGPFCTKCNRLHECNINEAKEHKVKKLLYDEDQSKHKSDVKCINCNALTNPEKVKICKSCKNNKNTYCIKCYKKHKH